MSAEKESINKPVHKDIPQQKHNQTLVSLLSISVIIIGLLLITISQTLPQFAGTFWKDLLFGIGLALAPSGAIGLIGDYLVFGRTMEALNDSNEDLSEQVSKLKEQVKALGISTDFLKQSSELGLVMIFPDRHSALEAFMPLIVDQVTTQEDEGRLIVVGSSIKGLREGIENLDGIITTASKNPKCDFRILLTHPEYCRFRENQERRQAGAIEEEIFQTILLLEEKWKGRDEKSIEKNVRLYKGTPTCFMIIAGDHMLINPYPYEKEAYKSFCLWVKKPKSQSGSKEVSRSIYKQFLENHFDSPWCNALSYKHFPLEGPIPNVKKFGHVFIIQDSSKFRLTVILDGDKDAEVKGIPTSVPYQWNAGNVTKAIRLGEKFEVNLLPIPGAATKENTWVDVSKISQMGTLELDKDRRTGKVSGDIEGHFFNEYQEVGLFDKKYENDFENADYAKRGDLVGQKLPMFWHWVPSYKMGTEKTE